MGKEYSYLSNSYMSSLINEINKHAKLRFPYNLYMGSR